MTEKAMIEKAKRRIRRFIKTGKEQTRVEQVDERTFHYKERHHEIILKFRTDCLGRLRRI